MQTGDRERVKAAENLHDAVVVVQTFQLPSERDDLLDGADAIFLRGCIEDLKGEPSHDVVEPREVELEEGGSVTEPLGAVELLVGDAAVDVVLPLRELLRELLHLRAAEFEGFLLLLRPQVPQQRRLPLPVPVDDGAPLIELLHGVFN